MRTKSMARVTWLTVFRSSNAKKKNQCLVLHTILLEQNDIKIVE